jgi:hypothetical protein
MALAVKPLKWFSFITSHLPRPEGRGEGEGFCKRLFSLSPLTRSAPNQTKYRNRSNDKLKLVGHWYARW